MRILYVDDIRFPKVWQNKLDKVTVARTYEQAIKNLVVHKFDVVDLDHDLAEEKTGYDIVKFMVENEIFAPTIYLHTANPVGRNNMKQLLERYTKSKVLVY